MINSIIDQVKPDYIQIDCKGHRGLSGYPTKVGNLTPGFLGDPLRTWREVVRVEVIDGQPVWHTFPPLTRHPRWRRPRPTSP